MLESKRDYSFNYYLFLLFGLGFLILPLVLFISDPEELKSSSELLVIICLIVPFSGILFIYYILVVDKIKIENDRLIIQSFWGFQKLDIKFYEIESWNELSYKTKNGTFTKLIIRTKRVKYEIEKMYYGNYYELKNQIIKERSEGEYTQARFDKDVNKYFIIAMIVFGLLVLSLYLYLNYF